MIFMRWSVSLDGCREIVGQRLPTGDAFAVPDLLISNAAVISKNARLWEVSAREFSEVIDVNISKGTANVIRHFAPSMVKRKIGVIVNFSSGWGRSTDAEVAPYCASKWAIEGLTQSLAQESLRQRGGSAVEPGGLSTPEMLRSMFGGSANNYPTADEWAKSCGSVHLEYWTNPINGSQLTVPIRGAND